MKILSLDTFLIPLISPDCNSTFVMFGNVVIENKSLCLTHLPNTPLSLIAINNLQQ